MYFSPRLHEHDLRNYLSLFIGNKISGDMGTMLPSKKFSNQSSILCYNIHKLLAMQSLKFALMNWEF